MLVLPFWLWAQGCCLGRGRSLSCEGSGQLWADGVCEAEGEATPRQGGQLGQQRGKHWTG